MEAMGLITLLRRLNFVKVLPNARKDQFQISYIDYYLFGIKIEASGQFPGFSNKLINRKLLFIKWLVYIRCVCL